MLERFVNLNNGNNQDRIPDYHTIDNETNKVPTTALNTPFSISIPSRKDDEMSILEFILTITVTSTIILVMYLYVDL